MKRLLLILFAIFLIASPVQGEFFKDVILTSPTGIWTDSRAYTTLGAAVTAIGASEQDLYIAKEEVVTTLVIPANIRLHFLKDGAIANSNTLAINTKNIHADHQIFTGAGAVNFASSTEVRTRWFEDFETAVTQTSNDTVTLLVDTADTLANSAAVGNNVLLKWNASNLITIAAGQTLSNIGNIDAPGFRLFVVSGAVAFKTQSPLKELRADWFGSTLATLDIADNAATAIGKSLLITPGAWVIDTDLTLSSNLKISQDADLQIATTKTLTINGTLDAGPYQIFSCTGTGKVMGGGAVKEVYPEWWAENISPGTTDMTAALNAAFAFGAGSLYLSQTYLLTAVTIPAAINVYGPGKLIGDDGVTGPSGGYFPTPGAVSAGYLLAQGSLDAGVAYGSAIAIGETSFTVANAFAAGDVVQLSNYPATVADRRKELLVVATATGAGFTTTTGVVQTYSSTTSLQFQKVNPIDGIHFESPNWENLQVMFALCRDVTISKGKALGSFVDFISCIQFSADFADWDANYTNVFLSVREMSRNFNITGNFTGGTGISDNGVLKVCGGSNWTADINVNGTVNDGGMLHGLMVDTYYASNPTGYENQATCYFNARVNVHGVYGMAVSMTSPATPTDVHPHHFYIDGQWGGYSVNLDYVNYGVIAGSSYGAGLSINHTSGIVVTNDNYSTYSIANNIDLQGIWLPFAPTVSGTSGSAPEPALDAAGTAGRYIKRGRMVTFNASYKWTDAGSRTGDLVFNVPYTMAYIDAAYQHCPVTVTYHSGLTTITNGVTAHVVKATATIQLLYGGSSNVALPASGFVTVAGSYEANQ